MADREALHGGNNGECQTITFPRGPWGQMISGLGQQRDREITMIIPVTEEQQPKPNLPGSSCVPALGCGIHMLW